MHNVEQFDFPQALVTRSTCREQARLRVRSRILTMRHVASVYTPKTLLLCTIAGHAQRCVRPFYPFAFPLFVPRFIDPCRSGARLSTSWSRHAAAWALYRRRSAPR